jgi:hypothetical protein
VNPALAELVAAADDVVIRADWNGPPIRRLADALTAYRKTLSGAAPPSTSQDALGVTSSAGAAAPREDGGAAAEWATRLALYCLRCAGTDASRDKRRCWSTCGLCGEWDTLFLVPERPLPGLGRDGRFTDREIAADPAVLAREAERV